MILFWQGPTSKHFVYLNRCTVTVIILVTIWKNWCEHVGITPNIPRYRQVWVFYQVLLSLQYLIMLLVVDCTSNMHWLDHGVCCLTHCHASKWSVEQSRWLKEERPAPGLKVSVTTCISLMYIFAAFLCPHWGDSSWVTDAWSCSVGCVCQSWTW